MLVPAARTDGQKMDSPRGWAAQQWMEWQKEAKSFDGIAAYNWTFNFLIRDDGSQSMQGMEVSKDYFSRHGAEDLHRRSQFPGFRFPDKGPVVKAILLGYEFWQRAFGGDRQIIGKTVRISRWDVPPTVIGVMEPGVRFLPSPGAAKEPKLRRQCDGRLLGADGSGPEVSESRTRLERSCATARWSDSRGRQ